MQIIPFFLVDKASCTHLNASFHYTHWHRFFPLKKVFFRKPTRPSLPLRKAPPLISVFSPQGRRGKPPSGARNRYALRLADHQRSTPNYAGWDRQDIINLLISYDSDSSTDNGYIPCSTSNLTSLALDLRKESVSKEIL